MRQVALGLALALAGPALAQEPAELPPASYLGQQYVDSRGCLFMRAGTPGNVLWLPRVTRDGVPLCGNPPSGNRVAVVGDGAPAPAEAPAEAPAVAAAPMESADPPPAVAAGGYFVAVGSFGVAENVTRALARLQALNYSAAQGRLPGAGGLVTVYAGPFPSAQDADRARDELAGLGFPDAMVIANP